MGSDNAAFTATVKGAPQAFITLGYALAPFAIGAGYASTTPRAPAVDRVRDAAGLVQFGHNVGNVLGALQELRKKFSKCEVVHTYLLTKVLNTELLNPRCNEGSFGRWTHHMLRPGR